MKIKILLSLLVLFYSAGRAQNLTLPVVWATDTVFDVPESTLYAHTENLIFVSNISGKPSEKDGKGFISTVSLSGKVYNLKWVEGLSAPKGMVLVGKKLYVSDINELVEIEIDAKKITNRYAAPNSLFLNDVTAGADGAVYVSDMNDQTIYQLANGELKKWLTADALKSVNGLTVVGDTLFAGTANAILAISLADMVVSVWADNTGGIDGLEWDGNSAFIYSDWKGHVYSIAKGGTRKQLVDSTPQKANAADIGFNKAKNIIYVPTFFDNRIVAYKLEPIQ